jgi:uncharacterized OB-fold protein
MLNFHSTESGNMSEQARLAAIEGWYSLDTDQPQLIGSLCNACGSYFFPKQETYCRNPACDGTEFSEVALSRHGTLWSYTNACYQPPQPYVAADPFEPFAIAAVQLEREQMVILGQVVKGVSVEDLDVGMPMELALESLHEGDEGSRLIWKWKPTGAGE